uniref:H(+)-exporting diphosphatase n=1 Tax=Pyrodinium bahamense TaxID=73915 RepID=A0A7S0B4T0_9DINO|mmetsp:Transcript_49958/g.138734  ORF Transcript_49958/g.138734 Transcript_49958/m.138734 type:complete len:765 (+) Transcript_49958:119-2413(+)
MDAYEVPPLAPSQIALPALGASGLCLLFVRSLWRRLAQHATGKRIGVPQLDALAAQIKSGAMAFLQEEYLQMSRFVVLLSAVLCVLFSLNPVVGTFDGPLVAAAFMSGAALSALAGWVGMLVATDANVRTTVACAVGNLNNGLQVAFTAGSVMGFVVVSLGLGGLTLCFLVLRLVGSDAGALQLLSGFSFGASTAALFARVAGGIYTKAADVAADLVGKVEADIDEDDPHNPAVIADNVGDNVGDVAGMGADLFESYVGSVLAAAALGASNPSKVALPFVLSAAGALCSMAGFSLVSTKQEGSGWNVHLGSLMWAMEKGFYAAGLAFTVCAAAICSHFFEPQEGRCIFACIVIGLVAGIAVGKTTEYFTSFDHSPVISIKDQGHTGPATVIIQGLSVGMFSTVPCSAILAVSILFCSWLSGGYGIAIASVGMLSTLGITLASDAYGPVADNAGGLAELANLDAAVRRKTDSLDALGNTTAAVGKGFAIGSAVLTSLSLLAAFKDQVMLPEGAFDVCDPVVLAGVLLGGMLPYLFAALTMLSVGKAAGAIIREVRRQFREVVNAKGITLMTAIRRASAGETIPPEEDVAPDSDRCVALATKAAIQEMLAPAMFAILAPLTIGFLVGPRCLMGALAGSIVSGCVLAIAMANAGGAWDNAKKLCEKLGIKKEAIGKACVVADTVGDPFKDTSGPALNILIKLMAITALTISPLLRSRADWETWRTGVLLLSTTASVTLALIRRGALSWGVAEGCSKSESLLKFAMGG